MKKLIGALTGFLATALVAAPVNTPGVSAQFEAGLFTGAQQDYTLRASYVSDLVKDRKLRDKATREHLSRSELTKQGVSLTVGVLEHFDLYAHYGNFDMTTTTYKTPGDLGIKSAPGHYWSAGARACVWSQDNTSLDLFADYGKSKADVRAVSVGAINSAYTDNKIKGEEWQAGLGLSQVIQVSPDMTVVPGLSVRFSDAHYHFKGSPVTVDGEDTPITLSRAQARTKAGVALSCGIFAGKMFGLKLETRLVDELAGSISAEIRL